MRLLHDYNFSDLEEMELAFCRATWKLDVVMSRIHGLEKLFDDAAVYLLDQLLCEMSSASQDFSSLVSRVNRDAVPPEGAEDVKAFLLKLLKDMAEVPEGSGGTVSGGDGGEAPHPDTPDPVSVMSA